MKLIFILIATCFILPFNTSAKNKNFGDVEVIKVTSIYDGDSFRADLKGLPAIIGEQLIKHGHAVKYSGKAKPDWCT